MKCLKFIKSIKYAMLISLLIFFITQLHISTTGFVPEISDPARIPFFDEFSTVVITPGEKSDFKFKIYNRYEDTIESATVRIEIYEYQTVEKKTAINAIEKSPVIAESNSCIYNYKIRAILPTESVYVKFKIITYPNTPEGSYVLRFNLTFTYENITYTMLSRGHYSDEDWEYARKTGENYPGKINLDFLEEKYGSCGVLPDSQFSVKSPIPMWPFFLLVGLAILFATLAFVFYLQEETGAFPKAEKFLKVLVGKINQKVYLRKVRRKRI
jgi:hypothetical protein